MEEIKVSVVIPVYNVDKFLNNTLSDITGQTLKEIEIICVDDGSTDKSCEIIEEWMKKDSRIQLIKQTNQYAGVARNNGLKKARGKYVIFWDADDLFEEKALEVLYTQAEKEQSDICICGARKYDNERQEYTALKACLNEDLLPEKETFNKFDVPDNIFNLTNNVPWNKLYRTKFVLDNKLEYQAIKQANDTYFTIMALFLAERITYVKDILIAYRVNNEASLTGKASDTVFCAYDSWLYTKERIEKYPDFKMVQKSFLNRALGGFHFSLSSQSVFSEYEKLYCMLVEKGFHEFGLDEYSEEDIYIPWMYKDMKKMYMVGPADFILQKNMARRINNEIGTARRIALKQRIAELKQKNAHLMERNTELKGKVKSLRAEVISLREQKKVFEAKEKSIQEQKKALQAENKKLQKQISDIKNTKAYKLGNKVMWLPRKIRGTFS